MTPRETPATRIPLPRTLKRGACRARFSCLAFRRAHRQPLKREGESGPAAMGGAVRETWNSSRDCATPSATTPNKDWKAAREDSYLLSPLEAYIRLSVG